MKHSLSYQTFFTKVKCGAEVCTFSELSIIAIAAISDIASISLISHR